MSIADWKEQEKEQRRNYITDAAEKLFFSHGYDNVTMDDIAKEVGLTKKSLYLYFKNKESLFFAVVLRGTRILNALVKEDVKNGKNGFESLWEIGHAYYTFVRKYPDYNRACNYFYSERFDTEKIINLNGQSFDSFSYYSSGSEFWDAIDLATITNGEVIKEIIGLRHDIFVIMCDAIKQGIADGAFRQDVDPVEAATIFTMLLESRPNMRPDLRIALKDHGIDQSRFARDIGDFVRHMLINNENPNKGRP
jgi:AcrR family transcriptional regulator